MNVAAIYARKSTDQNIVDEARSVTRQIQQAKTYAQANGWKVDERFIFSDDGISGAEFDSRPGFMRLMASLGSKRQKPAFQVLIVSELSRLGREQLETGFAVKKLSEAGVKIYSYLERREIAVTSATDKFIMNAVNFAAEVEREKARQRAEDTSFAKARAGLVTGGRTYGYDNTGPKGQRLLRINAAEAAIVVRIYEMYSQGFGFRHIAHVLNEQRVPTPRAQRGRPNGWDQGTIKAVLERSVYRGVVEYGKTRKRDSWGRKKIAARPPNDLIRVEKPELRIISPELEAQVDALRTDRREQYLRNNNGQLLGRPILGRYLLSGMLRCPCGANFEAQKSKAGLVYVCSAHRRKGKAICPNALALPILETDDRVLTVIEGEVLTDAFIERVLDTVFVPSDLDQHGLEMEAQELEGQIGNLTDAIKIGGNIPALVESMKATQARLVLIRRQLEPREAADRVQLREALGQRVSEWKQILRKNPGQGRQVLHHLLGTINLWVGEAADLDVVTGVDPNDRRGKENLTMADIQWSAETRPAGLLAGIAQVQGMASPRRPVNKDLSGSLAA